MITAEHKRIRPMVMLYLWISRCCAKEEKARKAKVTRKAKAKAKARKVKARKVKATKTKTRKAKAKVRTMPKPSTLLDTVFSAKVGDS